MAASAAAFDWHVTPSDRFTFESQFARLGKDDLALADLEPLYQQSRLSQEEFVQIWALVSLSAPTINEEQYIYFRHVLESRRRGRTLPVGVPLDVKERFLKSKTGSTIFVRTTVNHRDPAGGNLQAKDLPALRADFQALDLEYANRAADRQAADDQVAEKSLEREELAGLEAHAKRRLDAVRDDVAALRRGVAAAGDGPGASAGAGEDAEAKKALGEAETAVGGLRAERDALVRLLGTLKAELDAAAA
ncbi:hypothetical protein DFJ73DRAFT_193211 [Zopfochytrium polystomum]|nr:hypothetical protein DFJ73DRAFT_193211 [Zopfochytrium polystomum]